jgi:Ca2+-binding RTX toxin-like protein
MSASGISLAGGGGNDTLIGGLGSDTLFGGGGNDSLDGGAGVNTAIYTGQKNQYIITPDGVGGFIVQDTRVGPQTDGLDHISNIQFLQFADQTSAPSAIAIGANLTATAAITTLQGSGGNDTLNGGPSADTLIGGGGNDTFYVNNAADVVVAAVGSGVDTVYVSAASWVVTPGAGIQRVIGQSAAGSKLTGNAYAMELDGAAGADTLSDGGAADTLVGGAGNDTYVVANPGTVVVEALNGGFDTINTSLSSYTLPANVEALTYTGSGNFYGVGNNLNDIITGGAGYNTLVGGTGLDTFYIKSANTQIIVANPNPGDMVVSESTAFTLPNTINLLKLQYTGAFGVANNNNDTISGSTGGQIFVAGTGNDVFNPIGAGDIFVYNVPIGNDVINNFLTASDAVRLGGYGLSTLAQVQALMTQQGSNVVLQLAANSSITFTNTTLSAFTAANFQLKLDPANLSLTFDDEFNSLSLSNGLMGTWSTTYGFAGASILTSRTLPATAEQELYVDPNYAGVNGSTPLGLNPFSITGGVLSITAQVTPAADLSLLQNMPYTSGLLTTQSSFAQTYGYYEIKARLPSGQGAWPAFWLLPVSGLSPPEIDVLEANAANPNTIFETVHDLNLPTAKSSIANYLAGATTGFHTYGLMWDPTHITWYIDGTEFYQIATPADMNQPMYMLLDLAVGGGFGGTVNPSTLSANGFQIDYVRAYAINGVTIAEQAPTAPVQSITSGLAATTPYNDTVIGGAGFTEQIGHNADIDGGNGFDTVVYSGTRSQYSIYNDSTGGYYVVNNAAPLSEGADHLVSIEAIQFADGTYKPASIAANDYIVSSGAPEVISGYSGNNILYAGSSYDTVIAGSGADTVVANIGHDVIYGGGDTTAVFTNPHQNYSVYQDGNGGFYVVDHTVGSPANGVTDVINVQYLSFSDYTLPTLVAWQSVKLAATAPNQLVTGNIGYDTFVGGLGGDTLAGGSGLNTALFTGLAAQYLVYAGAGGGYDVEYPSIAGSAAPVFDTLTSIQLLQFSDGVQNAANLVSGQYLKAAAGGASLTGGAGNDWLVAGPGEETLDGGGGVNVLSLSGPAADYAIYRDGSGGFYILDRVQGAGANGLDHIVNIQTLQFSDQSASPASLAVGSVLTLPTGPARLTGTSGNDIIIDSGGGGDTIVGAAGANIVAYSGAESQYTVYADGSGGYYAETNALGPTPSLLDHLTNIQTLQFSDQSAAISSLVGGSVIQAGPGAVTLNGTTGADILVSGTGVDTLNGNGGADVFYVNNYADVINEAAGSGAVAYVSAPHWSANATAGVAKVIATGTAAINLTGNGYAMTLVANNGIDTLSDNGVADTLIGGTGMDTFLVANAATVVQALNAGNNTVKTSLASYTLPANVQNLTYTGTGAFYGVGGSLAGTLTGGVGNDTLVSGTGAEALVGGGGTDTFYVNNAADTVTASVGSHSVEFTSVASLKAAANIVALTYTGTGNFTGYANATGTFITGGHGNDFLDGGAGADTLDGGGGNDTLIAGTGADQFRFDAPSLGVDQISGFVSGTDHIALAGSGFGLSSLAGVGFDIGAAPTVIANGHAQIVYNTTTGSLYFDASGGDGHLIQLANLTGHPAIAAKDFLLV